MKIQNTMRKIMHKNNSEDPEKAMLIGFAIGDALGVPVEFMERNYFIKHPVKDMMGYMNHNQPAGTWSDDTSLTLALIKGLTKKEFDLNFIANEMVEWISHGKYTAHGYVFDIGMTTKIALDSIKYGKNPLNAGGKTEYDNGNGSLMRILPLAFYLKNEANFEKRKNMIYDVSSITHAHMISKIACHFLVEWLILLVNGNNFKKAYKDTCFTFSQYYKDEYPQFAKIFSGDIINESKGNIKSTGYVIDTLESVIWCIFHTNSYKKAVLTAVNLGEDTDTIGAIVGGIAGVIYGYNKIPKKWEEQLANKELLYEAIGFLERL